MSADSHPFHDSSKLVDWSTLTPDRIQSDIEAAIAEAQSEIDAICEVAPEDATFENTFLALEKAGETLSRAWGRVDHLTSVKDSEALREAHRGMLPKVTEHWSRIPLNPKLWAALKSFAEKPAAKKLKGLQKRYFEETVADFVQAGADLPEDKKKRLQALNSELAEITKNYSENVLDSTNAYELLIDDESRLAGLPDSAKAAARQSAKSKGHGSDEKPVWRFTLQVPSYLPVLKYADDASLRKEIYEEAAQVGLKDKWDNTQLIREILTLRQEKAQLLGKANFADQVLQRRMARSGQQALDFVQDLHAKTKPVFDVEIAELEAFVAERTGQPVQKLEPWDVSYWSEKLRLAKYDFDEEALRPYFSIDGVLDGMFRIAERIFGLRIQRHDGSENSWHPDVKLYDLYDEGGELLGYFYADWHPREEKRGGAWMNYLDTGEPQADGSRSPHVGLITGNLSEPVDGKPALLLHYEVETIFHEFGHLLHHLLGRIDIKSLNGVNVAWDFVELPSQIMENWCWNRESLDQFARHYETGEPIPEELFQKMVAARNFQSAAAMMRQLSLGKMDLEMHLNPERYLKGDLDASIRETLKGYQAELKTTPRSIVRRFGHLFSSPVGYAAGYYSYKWAEVLDADAFTRFETEGVFNEKTGRAFRECILSKGNSEDPMALFKAFMGREPDSEALLVRSGLAS
ncbi:M3 family metallopeptidase [Pelagicoccus sp. SDUM812003]|uniref:M3 family metallopeptidase n=1 Tax=Pelagicoccus sp. SDUM812003 TaxID=3041267 RepID=UPI00280CA37C|nr:M3 family metallopeptidase [Pelagicoccus sp. SDUM812003]MDQ8202465.1 M3 family metallopeptidase [Pelagicoccus sp. SDUM812003]